MPDPATIAAGAAVIAVVTSDGEIQPVGTGHIWIWPVPTLHIYNSEVSYVAKISSGYGDSLRGVAPNQYPHGGSDIMYKRRTESDMPGFPKGQRGTDDASNGSKWYFAPPGTPIIASRSGACRKAWVRTDGGGTSITIDHGADWSSYYTHLTISLVKTGQGIAQGQVIGFMGASHKYTDGEKLRHLHFETRYKDKSIDPRTDAVGGGRIDAWPRPDWRPHRILTATDNPAPGYSP